MHLVFHQFLFAGLDGEVALGEGDRFLTGVVVLGYQVAGVACEHDVFDFQLSALAMGDQFRDATKMIGDIVTSLLLIRRVGPHQHLRVSI
jgi:hypothetical protein